MVGNKISIENNEKKFYLLLLGVEEFHDFDMWYGIYDNTTQPRIAYEKTLEKLKKEDWITTEKLMTYQFKENYRNNSQNHRKIFSKELWT
jgi:hypothetical protein